MNRFFPATLVTAIIATACGPTTGSTTISDAGGADVRRGAEAFANSCAQCHGDVGQGTDQGPPFIHQFYVPSHHGDDAFRLAPVRGVQPHHWDFGPMPPVEGITPEEIEDIIAFVRSLQRDTGLIE